MKKIAKRVTIGKAVSKIKRMKAGMVEVVPRGFLMMAGLVSGNWVTVAKAMLDEINEKILTITSQYNFLIREYINVRCE